MKTLSLRTAKHSLSALLQQSRNTCGTNVTKDFSTTPGNWCAVSMAYNSFQSTRPEQISDKPPIVIMHGLLGSKTNWKGLGKALNQKTGRDVYTVDARNHGDSPHTDELNYLVLADDLLHFLEEHNIPKAVMIGHSMGGRAAMGAALKQPSSVERLMVLDITPFGVSRSISKLPRFVEVMNRALIPPELSLHQGKKYVDELLQPLVPELPVRQFLLMNLMKGDAGFHWRVNLGVIANSFSSHLAVYPLADSGLQYTSKTAFIGGALSDYIRPEDHGRIKGMFPLATFQYIEGAGHWLHADKPNEFLQLATSFIES